VVLRQSHEFQVVPNIAPHANPGVRMHFALKSLKHRKLFLLIEGQIQASVHVLTSSWSSDARNKTMGCIMHASEDPPVGSVFLDEAC
jgi:hypothetical protein